MLSHNPKIVDFALLGRAPIPLRGRLPAAPSPACNQNFTVFSTVIFERKVPVMAWNFFGKKENFEEKVAQKNAAGTTENAVLETADLENYSEDFNEKKKRDYSKLKRNVQVNIRLSPEESSELKEAAAAANMSLGDFVLAGMNRSRRVVVPGGGAVRAELIREGRNLNQAIRLCYFAAENGNRMDLDAVIESAKKVAASIEKFDAWIEKWDAEISKEVIENADSDMRSEQGNTREGA